MTRGQLLFACALVPIACWSVATGLWENDTLWHLGLGRAVLAAGARTVHEPWALPGEFPALCVVPEWLWDVVTFALQRTWGFVAVHAFVILMSALAPLAVAFQIALARPALSFAAFAAASGLSSAVLMARLGERPETLALSLACALLACAAGYARADSSPRRTRFAVCALLITLLWAQVHGTSILAPALFAAHLLPRLRAPDLRTHLPRDLAWLAALTLALFTSAHGFGLIAYVLSHASGDAVRHITDMDRTPWSVFSPASGVFAPLYGSMVLLGAAGALRARRVDLTAFALLLLGMSLAYVALRGLALAAVVTTLWTADGLEQLLTSERLSTRQRALLGIALAVLAQTRVVLSLDKQRDSFVRFGLADEAFPLAAARALAKAPSGTRALTSYSVGGSLGFLLDGRIKTWVDSRTPMYFDDLDFAVSRLGLRDADTVRLATRRFDFRVAVVRRDRTECAAVLASGLYAPIMIEPRFATFVRRDLQLAGLPPELHALSPCGEALIASDHCALKAELAQDIAQVRAHDSDLARFLELERTAECGGDPRALSNILLEPGQAQRFQPRYDRNLASIMVGIGRGKEAEALLHERIQRGDLPALNVLIPWLRETQQHDTLVQHLRKAADQLDDAAPADLLAMLASECSAIHDEDCTAFYGLRAAALHAPNLREVLEHLATKHSSARVRSEASHWQQVLTSP